MNLSREISSFYAELKIEIFEKAELLLKLALFRFVFLEFEGCFIFITICFK